MAEIDDTELEQLRSAAASAAELAARLERQEFLAANPHVPRELVEAYQGPGFKEFGAVLAAQFARQQQQAAAAEAPAAATAEPQAPAAAVATTTPAPEQQQQSGKLTWSDQPYFQGGRRSTPAPAPASYTPSPGVGQQVSGPEAAEMDRINAISQAIRTHSTIPGQNAADRQRLLNQFYSNGIREHAMSIADAAGQKIRTRRTQ